MIILGITIIEIDSTIETIIITPFMIRIEGLTNITQFITKKTMITIIEEREIGTPIILTLGSTQDIITLREDTMGMVTKASIELMIMDTINNIIMIIITMIKLYMRKMGMEIMTMTKQTMMMAIHTMRQPLMMMMEKIIVMRSQRIASLI